MRRFVRIAVMSALAVALCAACSSSNVSDTDAVDGAGGGDVGGDAVGADTGPNIECLTNADCADDFPNRGPCEVAVCGADGTCGLEPTKDYEACDDGDPCTDGTVCLTGACTGGRQTTCDDDNPCTDDACDADAGGCTATPRTGQACDDGDPCTDGETCDATGVCGGGAYDCAPCTTSADCAAFDDADLCNGTLECVDGTCQIDPDTRVTCDTSADPACQETRCVPATGQCVRTAAADGSACEDGSSCTREDACAGGACEGGEYVCGPCTVTADCTSFDDEDLCNGTLDCIGGECAIDPTTVVTCPPSDDACQVAFCDAATGACDTRAVADGAACDDGDACTTADRCRSGDCTGAARSCDDGDACTTDACNATTGQCDHTPVGCDDDDACTADSCNPETGACVHTPEECDDGDACTTDVCDTATGECESTPVDCDDDNVCTEDECNPANGECVHTERECDDSDACTTDACNPATGACAFVPITCDDDDACTTDSCVPATGCAYADISCDDQIDCTVDSCVPATGCVHDDSACGGECVDDGQEDNDTLPEATPVEAGELTDLAVCADDQDWYAIDVCAGGTLTVDVRFVHADGDIDAVLVDADGNILAESDSSDDDEQLLWQAGAGSAQQVYVAVYGFSGAENVYDLSVAVADCEGPVCVDDDLEDNDAQADAVRLPGGTTGGLAICAGDDDWFSIDVCNGATVDVTVAFVHADGDLDVALVDASGAVLADGDSSDDDESIAWTATSDEPVFLRVYGFSGAENDYSVTVTVGGCGCEIDDDCPLGQVCVDGQCVPQAVCEDDGFEDNDDAATAQPLEADSTYAGLQICPEDFDWYEVQVCAGGTLVADVSFTHADGDLDAALVAEDGTVLAISESVDDDEQLTFLVAADEAAGRRLFVVVFGFGGAENVYDLTITVVDCAGPVCVDDAQEDNDDQATATPAGPGAYEGLAVCAADADWFAIPVCAGGTLTARVLFTNADGDLDAELYDAAAVLLASSTSSSDNEEVRWTATDAATVYLTVYGFGAAENTYGLELTVEGCGCQTDAECPPDQLCSDGVCVPRPICEDDAFEDNDDAATAQPLDVGVYAGLQACPEDLDWYAVQICAGGTLTADVYFAHAGGDIDAALVAEDGTVLAISESVDDDEQLVFAVSPDEVDGRRLFVVVFGFGGAQNAYDLAIAVDGCAGPVCVDDALEDNDDAATATPAGPGVFTGFAVCADDADWYAIPVCAGGTLTARVLFSHADGDIDTFLYDAGGNTLAGSTSTSDNEEVRWTATDAATVYLDVYGYASAENTYGLDIAVADCGCETDQDCPAGQLCTDGVCVPRPICEDDPLEDNDDQATALPLDPGAYAGLQVCAEDLDWYEVQVCAGGTLTVDVLFTHAAGDVDAALIAEDGTQLAISNGTADAEQLVFQVSPDVVDGRRLFVVVYGFAGAENAYDLAITVDGCEGPVCVDDGWEDNDDQATATGAGAGVFTGFAVCANDPDWYAIPVCAGGTLTARVLFTHANGDIDAVLRDAQGNELATGYSVTDNEELRWTATDAATVYLIVYGWQGAENTYDLDLALANCGCETDQDCPAGQLCSDGVCVPRPVCEDDGAEDNDDQATAFPLDPGFYTGLQVCTQDADWFEVQVCAGGTLTVDVLFTHAAGDVDAALFAEDGTQLAISNGTTDAEQLLFQVSPDEVNGRRLFVVVYGFAGAENAYDLSITVDGCEGPVCVDDRLEDNDDQASATEAFPGVFTGFAVCADDLDWYAIPVCAGGTLTARVLFTHALGDIDAVLEDAQGNVLAAGTSITDNEDLRWTATDATTAYLVVYGYAGAENTYDLDLALANCGCETDQDCPAGQMCSDGVCVPRPVCEDDVLEDNDDQASAWPLDAGAYAGLQVCAQDADWYEVQVCAGGTLTVDVLFSHAGGDVDAVLVSEDGTELLRSDSSDDNEQLVFQVSPDVVNGRRLFVVVYGFAGAENAYDLAIAVDGCAGPVCVDDFLEDNDDQATATGAGPGVFTGFAVCADDADWYAIPVCAGGTLTARVLFTHALGDVDAVLRDAQGNVLAAGTSIDDDEELRWTATDAATVYLVVYGYAGAENTYDLDLALANCGCETDQDCPAGQLCSDGVCVPRPVCEDDVLEDNDDQASAWPLDAGAYAGLQVCTQDADWYEVQVCAGGSLTVDVLFTHAAGDIDAALFAEDGTQLAISNGTTDAEQLLFQVSPDVVNGQRLFVVVYGFAGAENAYDLSIAIDGCQGPVCVDDELEDNDDLATATAAGPGVFTGFAVCADDADWYAIPVCAGGTLTARVLFTHAAGDIDAVLEDAQGNVLAASTGTVDNEELRWTVTDAATVYLVVYGWSGAENTYDLDLAVADCGCQTDEDCAPDQMCSDGACVPRPVCEDDPLEDSDTQVTAFPLEAGAYAGLQVCAQDADWYEVQVCAGGLVTVDVLFSHAAGDIDAALYADDGTQLDLSNGTVDNEQLVFQVSPDTVAGQRLYVVVYGFAGAENGYDLQITTEGCEGPVCVDDRLEDNDDLATATAIGPGTASRLAVCANDQDWYAIEVCAGGTLTARAFFTHAYGDVDVVLQDAQGVTLAASTSTADNEEVRWTATADTTVYLIVYGWSGAENTYQLDIETAGCGCAVDDSFEDNDSYQTALALEAGLYPGLRTCPADDDFYAIRLSAGEEILVHLIFAHAEGDIDLYLLDPTGAIVASSPSTDDDESVTHVAQMSGTYTIWVNFFSDAGQTPGNVYEMEATIAR